MSQPRPRRTAAKPPPVEVSFASGLASCFTYPLNVRYLLVIGGAALFTAIVSLFPMGNDIGYWFILLVVARVGFDIIDRFAAGYTVHAETPHEFPSGGFARPVKYWLILMGMDFLVSRYFRKYGYAAGLGMDIVTSLILPGMTIVLAMTGSLRSTFNPAEWLRVANGAPGTFVMLAFLSLGIDQLTNFANDILFPPPVEDVEVVGDTPLAAIGAYTVVMVYLWLVNFCMIGLAVHANREALALADEAAIKVGETPPELRARPPVESPLSAVRTALAAGKVEEASRGLSALVKAGNPQEAVALFKECAADPRFRVGGDEVLALARAARAMGEPATAVAIVRGFDKVNPGHADIPPVYLLSARIMAEDLGDPDQARKVLNYLVQRYPGHWVAPEAQRYLREMGAA
jgi:tetratricopeptide repeat protein